MDSIYRENILEHYQNPAHRGELQNATLEAHDANPLCGDDLTLRFRLSREGVIEDCMFFGHGCSISQAAADMLCEEIIGQHIERAMAMSREEILEIIGIPLGPVRVKCGLLAFKIMKIALLGWSGRQRGGISDEAQGL